MRHQHSRGSLASWRFALTGLLSIAASWGGAGVKLAPGTYSVSGFSARRQHFYFACSPRNTPFTLDFGGSTLVFLVRGALLLLERALPATAPSAGQSRATHAEGFNRLWCITLTVAPT